MTEQLLQPLKVALVAGEASGDILGGGSYAGYTKPLPSG